MKLTVSVILPTHDRPELLAGALDGLLAQSRLPEEIIVVNDGAADVPPKAAENVRAAGVRFVHERRDRPSLPASRNRGMEIARGDIIVFTEDDVTLPGDYLARLTDLYEADTQGVVRAIGGVVRDPGFDRLNRRVWRMLAGALAEKRWAPRVCAASYVSLPPSLRGRLVPARWISGGAISLRRSLAAAERFEEAFEGYAYAEDIEFCFRVGRKNALFLAPQLEVLHDPALAGRPDTARRGRMYAANLLHIARHSVEGGAGMRLLFAYNFLGMTALHAAWSLLTRRREHLLFAAGMAREILHQARRRLKGWLCES